MATTLVLIPSSRVCTDRLLRSGSSSRILFLSRVRWSFGLDMLIQTASFAFGSLVLPSWLFPFAFYFHLSHSDHPHIVSGLWFTMPITRRCFERTHSHIGTETTSLVHSLQSLVLGNTLTLDPAYGIVFVHTHSPPFSADSHLCQQSREYRPLQSLSLSFGVKGA